MRWEEFWGGDPRYGRAVPYLGNASLSLTKNRLNLGCGNVVLDGFDNVDIFPGPGVIQFDITRLDWPIDWEGYYDYILMSNILEHIPPGRPFWDLIDRLVEVSKDFAIWEVHGPDPRDVVRTLQNVGHTRLVGPTTFEPLCGVHQGRASSLTDRTDRFRLDRLDYTTWWGVNGPITDWHLRKYMGRHLGEAISKLVGRPSTLRLVYLLRKA